MGNKKIVILLLIIIGISLIFAYDIGNIKTKMEQKLNQLNKEIKENQYTSIKDIAQNKEEYIGKKVRIKGKLISRVGGDTLNSPDNYFIFINEKSCEEKNRDYYSSKKYVAEGNLEKREYNYFPTDYFFVCEKYLY